MKTTKRTAGPWHLDQYGHIYGTWQEATDGEIKEAGLPAMPTGSVKVEPHICSLSKTAKPGDGSLIIAAPWYHLLAIIKCKGLGQVEGRPHVDIRTREKTCRWWVTVGDSSWEWFGPADNSGLPPVPNEQMFGGIEAAVAEASK